MDELLGMLCLNSTPMASKASGCPVRSKASCPPSSKIWEFGTDQPQSIFGGTFGCTQHQRSTLRAYMFTKPLQATCSVITQITRTTASQMLLRKAGYTCVLDGFCSKPRWSGTLPAPNSECLGRQARTCCWYFAADVDDLEVPVGIRVTYIGMCMCRDSKFGF